MMLKEQAAVIRLGRHQERRALGRQGVALVQAGQKLEPHQRVEERGQTTRRSPGLRSHLRERAGTSVEPVKHARPERGLDDEGGSVAPGKLHDTLGGQFFG